MHADDSDLISFDNTDTPVEETNETDEKPTEETDFTRVEFADAPSSSFWTKTKDGFCDFGNTIKDTVTSACTEFVSVSIPSLVQTTKDACSQMKEWGKETTHNIKASMKLKKSDEHVRLIDHDPKDKPE